MHATVVAVVQAVVSHSCDMRVTDAVTSATWKLSPVIVTVPRLLCGKLPGLAARALVVTGASKESGAAPVPTCPATVTTSCLPLGVYRPALGDTAGDRHCTEVPVDQVVVRHTSPPSTATVIVATPVENTRPVSVTGAPPDWAPFVLPRLKVTTGASYDRGFPARVPTTPATVSCGISG